MRVEEEEAVTRSGMTAFVRRPLAAPSGVAKREKFAVKRPGRALFRLLTEGAP